MAKKIEIENDLATIIKNNLNKKFKESSDNVAYILGNDFQTSSDVKFWIPTGIPTLDLAISNRTNGGYPTGRIIEITGLEASGKSLLAAYAIANVQKMGGIGILIDTETAISREFLEAIGVDLNAMVYAQLETVEDIFQSIEYLLETITKEQKNDIPIVIVVDSIAAATTKIEQAADYDKDGYATSKALILSKAMRKITNLIGKKSVALIITNQLRTKLNVSFGDPYCVCPYTTNITIRYKNKSDNYVIEDLRIDEFSDRFCNNDDFENPEEFDLSEYELEIASKKDYDSNEFIWNPIKTFIIKLPVNKYYTDGKLNCSQNHKILTNDKFVKVKDHPDFKEVKEERNIVDFELGGNHTYIANGRINHNTTSGGMAIKFHCSVRLRLKQMGQLKAKVHGIDQTVGIKTRAQVIKNRVGPPYRTADFDIYFDSGIDEVGSILQTCKDLGIITQSGAWATYLNTDTGEEIKFQSKDFLDKIYSKPEHKEFLYKAIAAISIVKYKPTIDQEIEVDENIIEE